jgi:hypothetical protein
VEEDASVDERRDDEPDGDGASDAAAVERDGLADDAFVPSPADVRERSSTRPGVGAASTPARAAAGSKSGNAGVDIASTCSRNHGGRSALARSNRSRRLESARYVAP